MTTAILGNAIVTVAKGVGFMCTGSGSMLSEAVHSIADTSNQCLLAYGVTQSQRDADITHPYGYLTEQYVWSLVSGVGIFFIGGGVSVYHGVTTLMHPEPLHNLEVALGILAFAGSVEGYTMQVAYSEMKREADKVNMSIKQYLTSGPDPVNVAVFLEDAAAVAGVGVASTCIGLTYFTGNPMYDAIGSISVGCMLGGVASFIVLKNKSILMGQSIAPERTEEVIKTLLRDLSVSSIHDVKSVMVGPGVARFIAELHLDTLTLTLILTLIGGLKPRCI